MRVKLSRFMTKGAPILMPVSSSAAAAAYQQTKARESKQRLYKGRPPQQPKRPPTARKKEASLSSASVGSSAGGGGGGKQGSFASDFALPHQPISPSPRQPAGQAVVAKRTEAADAGGQLPPPQPTVTSSSVVFIDSHKSGASAVSLESHSSAGGSRGRRDRKTSAVSVITKEESQD